MLANGEPVDFENFRHICGYVLQSDSLYPHLSVRETIQYAAYLRCHKKTKQECQDISADLIKQLRLESCADDMIGNAQVRGISGGQMRRVTIAVDIVHQPSVILVDEPTNGLDSLTAFGVVDTIKSMAESSGQTVIMAVNQPTNKLFNLFDRVMFLSSGSQVYYGPTEGLMPHTRALIVKHDVVPVGWHRGGTEALMEGNPPEVFLEVTDQFVSEGRIDVLVSESKAATSQRQSEVSSWGDPSARLSVFGGEEGKSMDGLSLFEYSNTLLREIKILNNRQFKTVFRSPEVFRMRLGACVCFGVLLGTFFLDTKNDPTGADDRASYFIFICAFFYFTSLDALQAILAEREIFQREFSRLVVLIFAVLSLSVSPFPLQFYISSDDA
jgi:ABC-type multidrug transport system ATPase subunit